MQVRASCPLRGVLHQGRIRCKSSSPCEQTESIDRERDLMNCRNIIQLQEKGD